MTLAAACPRRIFEVLGHTLQRAPSKGLHVAQQHDLTMSFFSASSMSDVKTQTNIWLALRPPPVKPPPRLRFHVRPRIILDYGCTECSYSSEWSISASSYGVAGLPLE